MNQVRPEGKCLKSHETFVTILFLFRNESIAYTRDAMGNNWRFDCWIKAHTENWVLILATFHRYRILLRPGLVFSYFPVYADVYHRP